MEIHVPITDSGNSIFGSISSSGKGVAAAGASVLLPQADKRRTAARNKVIHAIVFFFFIGK